MDSTSPLQQQFPLSPRKFWKKMIPKIVGLAFIPLLMLLVFSPFYLLAMDGDKAGVGTILAIAIPAFVIFYLILILPYVWYIKTYIKRYYYSGEENFITIKKGVFAPTEIHVQWQKIQDVYVDQDILDRIMGLYDVHIASATASSGIEAHIDGVDQVAAEGLKEFLLNKVSGAGRNYQNVAPATIPETGQPFVPQTPPQSAVINLSEEISSNTYPLSGKWIAVSLWGRIVSATIYPGIFLLMFLGKSKDPQFIDNWFYFILGWIALSILMIIVRTITLFLWKKNYAFNLTSDNIYYREGVISMSEKHMPYSSIQDVSVKQGVIERMFGLAKVVIENAAQQTMVTSRGGRVSVFTGVMIQGISLADANKITDILKTTVLGRKSSQYGL